MAPPNMTETDMGAWLFRIGMGVIGFFLCLGVKDAKKSIDQVPGLVAQVTAMEKSLGAAFDRIGVLEKERREK